MKTPTLIAVCVLAVSPAAASAADSSPPPSLTGEFLLHAPSALDGSVQCTQGTGAGADSYQGTVSGTATGPYPGTFTATFTKSATGNLSETFSIDSPTGTVTGTKSGNADLFHFSACQGFYNSPDSYTANIVTATGAYGTSGTSHTAFFNYFYDSAPAQYTFQEYFQTGDVPTLLLPTSKDQCKNGGYRTYGQFKNQGDCVSFVANGK